MTTAGNLIDRAYLKIGVDSPTTAQDTNGLATLNDMISSWGADFMVPAPTEETHTLTAGTESYTVGSGGDLDTVRPIGIQSCFLRDSDGYDYPVKALSATGYDKILDKDASGRPTAVYFHPTVTTVTLYFNKAPDAAYTAYFKFWKNFTEFALTSTTVTLPNIYKRAIILNLAIDLSDNFDRTVSQRLIYQAEKAYEKLEAYIASSRPVPLAQFGFSGSRYNINTDEGA